MDLKIIYQDNDLLVIDKPAGINSDDFENRIHRLDKDTSGILLVAKSNEALDFFQKQFKNRKVIKKYLALAVGNIKTAQGKIETLMGRSLKDRKKQKTYLPNEPDSQRKGLRKAITEYRVLERFTPLEITGTGEKSKGNKSLTGFKDYTLIEAEPKTGRKHQIRCHLAYLGFPIAGDKVYGFKNQPIPKGLKRQFLHATYLKIQLPNGTEKEFKSQLPEDLRETLEEFKNQKSKIKMTNQNSK